MASNPAASVDYSTEKKKAAAIGASTVTYGVGGTHTSFFRCGKGNLKQPLNPPRNLKISKLAASELTPYLANG